MRKYINPSLIIVIIIYFINSKLVLESINPELDVLSQIISASESQLNGGISHYYIYSLMLLFAISNIIAKDPTLKIYRYQTKEKYYIKQIVIPTLIQILFFIGALFIFIIGLAMIKSVFSLGLIGKLLINLIFYITFYAFFVNIYYLFCNLNLNKFVAILPSLLIIIYFYSGTNFITNSFYLLIGALGSNISITVVTSFIFWLAINWILLLINLSLFNKKDVL